MRRGRRQDCYGSGRIWAFRQSTRPAICYPALAASSSLKREVVEGLDLLIVRELDRRRLFRRTQGDRRPRQRAEARHRHPGLRHLRDRTHRRVAFELARTRRNARRPRWRKAQRDEVGRAVAPGGDRDRTRPAMPTSSSTHMLARCRRRCSWCAGRSSSTCIVTDNLFGDMLSDVAAMLTGSLGMLPSASLWRARQAHRRSQGARTSRSTARRPTSPAAGRANPIADLKIAAFGHVPSPFLRHAAGRPTRLEAAHRRRSRRRAEDPGHHVGRQGRGGRHRGHGRCRSREVPRLSWLSRASERCAAVRRGRASSVRRFCRLCPAEATSSAGKVTVIAGDSADQGQLVAEGQQRSRHADRADERDEDGARQRSVLFHPIAPIFGP